MDDKLNIEELIDRVVSDKGSNNEYLEMVELIANDEEISRRYVDACDRLSAVNTVAMCVKGLDDELLEVITDIESTTEKIDGIVEDLDTKIENLLLIKERYRKCQKCSVESNMSVLEEQVNKINAANIQTLNV